MNSLLSVFCSLSLFTGLAANADSAKKEESKNVDKMSSNKDEKVSVIKFIDAKIFAPLKGSTATAGYVKIENTSAKAIVLKAVKAIPFRSVELHESTEKNGRMAMKKRESLTILPQKTLELKPGGYHIMLFAPATQVRDGETVTIVFLVDKTETAVPFKVVPRIEHDMDDHHNMHH